jgi:hypothetical protein
VPEPDILTSLSDSTAKDFESTREANGSKPDDPAAFARLSGILKSVNRVSSVSERAIKAWIRASLDAPFVDAPLSDGLTNTTKAKPQTNTESRFNG